MSAQHPTQGEQLVGMRKDIDHLIHSVDEWRKADEQGKADRLAELKAIREDIAVLTERQTKTETRVDKVLGNVRAFGAGMAAAFTLIGTALGAGLSSFLEWLK